jgi:hypothetical protein
MTKDPTYNMFFEKLRKFINTVPKKNIYGASRFLLLVGMTEVV